MKRASLILLTVLLACGAASCGGDDDPTGVAPLDTTQGVGFCCENAETAAGAVVTALDVFPDLNQVALLAVAAVTAYEPPTGEPPPAGYALGDLALCGSGSASAVWKDADDSRSLTAGDSFVLELEDCDGEVSGVFTLAFDEHSAEATGAAFDFEVAFVETFRDTFEVETWQGDFHLDLLWPSAADTTVRIRHRVLDPADGGARLRVELDGVTVTEMGCFDLRYTVDPETRAMVLDEPFAVFRVPGCGVMTMDSEGLSPFEYTGGPRPVRGQTRLRPEAGVAPCTGLDIAGSGVTTNCSTLAITLVAGGTVTLSGRNPDGAFFLVSTTWGDLH